MSDAVIGLPPFGNDPRGRRRGEEKERKKASTERSTEIIEIIGREGRAPRVGPWTGI